MRFGDENAEEGVEMEGEVESKLWHSSEQYMRLDKDVNCETCVQVTRDRRAYPSTATGLPHCRQQSSWNMALGVVVVGEWARLGGGARAEGGRGYIPPAQRLMTPPLSIAQTSNLRSPPRFGDETPATPNQTTFLTAHTSSHRQISLSDLSNPQAGRPRSHARFCDSLRRCAHKGHARRPTGLRQALLLDETVPFRRVISLDTGTRFTSLSAATLSVVRTRHLRPTTTTRP